MGTAPYTERKRRSATLVLMVFRHQLLGFERRRRAHRVFLLSAHCPTVGVRGAARGSGGSALTPYTVGVSIFMHAGSGGDSDLGRHHGARRTSMALRDGHLSTGRRLAAVCCWRAAMPSWAMRCRERSERRNFCFIATFGKKILPYLEQYLAILAPILAI